MLSLSSGFLLSNTNIPLNRVCNPSKKMAYVATSKYFLFSYQQAKSWFWIRIYYTIHSQSLCNKISMALDVKNSVVGYGVGLVGYGVGLVNCNHVPSEGKATDYVFLSIWLPLLFFHSGCFTLIVEKQDILATNFSLSTSGYLCLGLVGLNFSHWALV